jgi:hypothetical protein
VLLTGHTRAQSTLVRIQCILTAEPALGPVLTVEYLHMLVSTAEPTHVLVVQATRERQERRVTRATKVSRVSRQCDLGLLVNNCAYSDRTE